MGNLCDVINDQMRKLGQYTHLVQRPLRASSLKELSVFERFGEERDNCLELPLDAYLRVFDGIQETSRIIQYGRKRGVDLGLENRLKSFERINQQKELWWRRNRDFSSTSLCFFQAVNFFTSDSSTLGGIYAAAGAAFSFGSSLLALSPKTAQRFRALGTALVGGVSAGAFYILGTQQDIPVALPFAVGLPFFSTLLLEGILFNVRRHYYDIPALREKVEDVGSFTGGVRGLSNKVRRLSTVLREIQLMQNTPSAYVEENAAKLASFEDACKEYLLGEGSRAQINSCRTALNTRVVSDESLDLEQAPSGITAQPIMKLFKKEQHAQPNHPATYNLALSLDLGRDVANRIARTVPSDRAEYVMNRLSSTAGENARLLVQANPALLFMRKGECELFATDLEAVLREAGPSSSGHDLASNPVLYASREGLARVRASFNKPAEEHTESLPDGLNETLVSAILTRGFRLGSARPYIGMRYVSSVNLRHSTTNTAGGELMREFDSTFKRLIREGVILTDKEGKKAAGAGGCYSVNPHLSDIRNPQIRSFIEHTLYGSV